MTALVLGCSHTAGIGVSKSECYVSVLSDHYKTPFVNLAAPGANASWCTWQLINYLSKDTPSLVIAQWPNPVRRSFWTNSTEHFENINNASPEFRSLIDRGIENFYKPWFQAVVTTDVLCKKSRVPVIHILLEDLNDYYKDLLSSRNIVMHCDLKIPGQTWLFDSKGSDNLHHSAYCHSQWASRLIGLIDELT
jgi:hypothetical protein